MLVSSNDDTYRKLQEFIPLVATYGADGMSLDRMWLVLEKVGNPQDKLKCVHIAGTSGKTSTAYYIASLLGTSGLKVGLSVSPHVDSITERIQIDGRPILDRLFNSELDIFLGLINDIVDRPSFFELMIAFSLWEFARQKVDYAVIETGMGGSMDATNVLRREDKVCVITDIGFDHTDVLGETLAEIAAQKAGIIHEHNHVFMHTHNKSIMEAIDLRVQHQSAFMNIISENNSKIIATLSQLPKFQIRNWNLALKVSEFVSIRDSFKINETLNPLSIVVPARMEKILLGNDETLILDGAHNAQKMQSFVDSFSAFYPEQKATILLGLKKGKDFKSVLDMLKPITNEFIFTTFESSRDLPVKSQSTQLLKEYSDTLKIQSEIIDNSIDAYKVLDHSEGKIKIITGSFYLLGQVRPLINSRY